MAFQELQGRAGRPTPEYDDVDEDENEDENVDEDYEVEIGGRMNMTGRRVSW